MSSMHPFKINTFDIDGVIYMGKHDGVYPGKSDVIITGRSIDEWDETSAMLSAKGIKNEVFMNPARFENKTRKGSGIHKGNVIKMLRVQREIEIGIHFDDDPIQIKEIERINPNITCVLLQHELVDKENCRHKDFFDSGGE